MIIIIIIMHYAHLLHEYLCNSFSYFVDEVEENVLKHLWTCIK
jgi:hypothetical protein